MTDKIEERKKKIDEQIERNLKKKKLLLEKERKKRASRFKDIGKLAYRADIDQIDESALFGAFIEIAKNINDDKLKQWKEIAYEFETQSNNSSEKVFCISFLEDPSQEIKKILKENKFMWNRFRKEYYGKGIKIEIENLLKGFKIKIEEIIN